MTQQTELTDYDSTELVTDGGQEVVENDETFDPEAETVTDAWEGVFLHSSWGYNQTNVEMAQIVDVSDSGKTVLCRMVKSECVERGHGSDSMQPTAEQYGEEFRMQVRSRHNDEEPMFRGSYPYIDGTKESGTRLDNLYVFDNKPGETVHQTSHGYRH